MKSVLMHFRQKWDDIRYPLLCPRKDPTHNSLLREAQKILCFMVIPLVMTACSQTSEPTLLGLNTSRNEPETNPEIGLSNLTLMNLNTPNNSNTVSDGNNGRLNVLDAPQNLEQKPNTKRTSHITEIAAKSLDIEEAKVLINEYRKKNNLPSLKLNILLTEAAKTHSTDLSKWDRISHYGSDGSNPLDRVRRTGYNPKFAAENIGSGQIDFQNVLDNWIRSPEENKNLLSADVKDIGLAVVQDPKTEFKSFWVFVLASPE